MVVDPQRRGGDADRDQREAGDQHREAGAARLGRPGAARTPSGSTTTRPWIAAPESAPASAATGTQRGPGEDVERVRRVEQLGRVRGEDADDQPQDEEGGAGEQAAGGSRGAGLDGGDEADVTGRRAGEPQRRHAAIARDGADPQRLHGEREDGHDQQQRGDHDARAQPALGHVGGELFVRLEARQLGGGEAGDVHRREQQRARRRDRAGDQQEAATVGHRRGPAEAQRGRGGHPQHRRGLDAPVAQADLAVGVRGDDVVVRHEHDRGPALARGAEQQVEQLLAAHRVHAAGRLVGEDHGRTGDERAGDGDALRLAAGELGRQRVVAGVETGAIEPLPRSDQRGRPLVAVEQQRQRDVLEHRELWHELPELEHDPDAAAAQLRALAGVELGEVLAEQPHDAALGAEDAGGGVQQRRLAAAARAGDGDDLGGVDGERDAAQRHRAPVGVIDADHLEDGLVGHRMASSGVSWAMRSTAALEPAQVGIEMRDEVVAGQPGGGVLLGRLRS